MDKQSKHIIDGFSTAFWFTIIVLHHCYYLFSVNVNTVDSVNLELCNIFILEFCLQF